MREEEGEKKRRLKKRAMHIGINFIIPSVGALMLFLYKKGKKKISIKLWHSLTCYNYFP